MLNLRYLCQLPSSAHLRSISLPHWSFLCILAMQKIYCHFNSHSYQSGKSPAARFLSSLLNLLSTASMFTPLRIYLSLSNLLSLVWQVFSRFTFSSYFTQYPHILLQRTACRPLFWGICSTLLLGNKLPSLVFLSRTTIKSFQLSSYRAKILQSSQFHSPNHPVAHNRIHHIIDHVGSKDL